MKEQIKLMTTAIKALTTIQNLEELNIFDTLNNEEKRKLLSLTSDLICLKMDIEDRIYNEEK